jgi:ribosomal-protein-alanine N-acetyltransferase
MSAFVRITKTNFDFYKKFIMEVESVSFPSPWPLKSFEKEIDNPVSYLYVLVSEGIRVGYICYWEFALESHLMNIAVHPERRGQGYGRLLLEKMIKNGVSHDVKMAWLEVRPSNSAALDLYKKAGFKKISIRRGYYADTKEDAIIMALPIDSRGVPAGQGEKNEKIRKAL